MGGVSCDGVGDVVEVMCAQGMRWLPGVMVMSEYPLE